MPCIHGRAAAACDYCARQSLKAQVRNSYTLTKRGASSQPVPGFSGRSFRKPLYEKGMV